MGKPEAFMKKHGIVDSEIWQVRPGAFAIKHFVIERIAAQAGVKFDRPAILEQRTADGIVAMVVFGRLGDHEEWSTGECSPKNNKNQYPYAMAEKRGKGRVALKLLAAADNIGAALYSEEDSEDFKEKKDQNHGEDIITKDEDIQTLTVDAQRPIFSELEKELSTCNSVEECKRWTVAAKSRASRLSDHWRKILNGLYLKHLRGLEARDADEYIERMTG